MTKCLPRAGTGLRTSSFQERFGKPIQQHGDRDAANALRQLIRPFVPPRTKGQILHELPGKTEVTISVELGDGEASSLIRG